jgi:hypothetical protein
MAGDTLFKKLLAAGAVFGALAGAVACGPDGSQLLGGDQLGGPNGSSNLGGDAGNGGWNNNSTYNADGGPQAPLAQQLFLALQPQLDQKCGGACHQQGTTLNAPKWLAGPDEYKTVTTYPGIVTTDVYSSKLENRPANHPASCLIDPGNETLLASVTTWLTAEAAALTAIPLPASATVDPATGSVDLSGAATGINGAKITFTATQQGDLLRFSNVMLVAPSSTGLHIISPIFVQVPGSGPEVDNTDFSTLDMTVASGASGQISPVFYFPSWTPGSKLKIEFEKIEGATVQGSDAGTSTTTCKDLTDFQNSAAPSMKANCTSCHAGNNANATNSLNLTALNNNDYATACTQARTQVNLNNLGQSNILLAPLQQVNHPVKVFGSNTSTGYVQIQTWVNKE